MFLRFLKEIDNIILFGKQSKFKENVRNMFHSRSSFNGEVPIAVQEAGLLKRGYCGIAMLANSKDFGLPQSRTRCWGVYIRTDKHRYPSYIKSMMTDVFHRFQRKPLDVKACLLNGISTEDRRSVKQMAGEKWKDGYKAAVAALGRVAWLGFVFNCN